MEDSSYYQYENGNYFITGYRAKYNIYHLYLDLLF